MKEYTITSSVDGPGILIERVNELIGHGWIPTGGVFVIDSSFRTYYQAMVKDKESK